MISSSRVLISSLSTFAFSLIKYVDVEPRLSGFYLNVSYCLLLNDFSFPKIMLGLVLDKVFCAVCLLFTIISS